MFNNVIIFVLLFDKTVKLLLPIMLWLEESKESLILVMSLRKDNIVVLDDYGMSLVINNGIWLVSLDCLNTLIMMKSATENVIPVVLVKEHLPSPNRWKQ